MKDLNILYAFGRTRPGRQGAVRNRSCVSQRFARFPTLLENQASARRDTDEKSVRGRHDTRV